MATTRVALLWICLAMVVSTLVSQAPAKPMGQAERLIRALNLFHGSKPNLLSSPPRILEKPINLHLSVEPAISDEDLGHHAGYFNLKGTHASRMFYMFFESRGDKTKDPVVLWMSGGPGCSSELALFYENGPFQINNDLKLIWNQYGWDQASNIIFVDQPIGTGFSYTTDDHDIRHDEKGVSDDMYQFLQAFFELHPEFAGNDFFVTGESYAGHYVPAVTGRIHQGNKAKEGKPINLKGFAIGNGLTNPEIQYQAYADYALSMGLIGKADHAEISKMYPSCLQGIKQCDSTGTSCEAAFESCNQIFDTIMDKVDGINYYDVRMQCEGSLCYDFSNMENYLNLPAVQKDLGVDNIKFVSCSPTVYQAMITDWMRNLESGIPTLLEDGIKLLVYAGDYDLICNWLGNSRWVSAVEWSGKKAYNAAKSKSFKVDGNVAGMFTTYGPLTFLKVHNAGHMVPMDQPKNSLEMIRRFTKGISLDKDTLREVVQNYDDKEL